MSAVEQIDRAVGESYRRCRLRGGGNRPQAHVEEVPVDVDHAPAELLRDISAELMNALVSPLVGPQVAVPRVRSAIPERVVNDIGSGESAPVIPPGQVRDTEPRAAVD